MTLEISKLNDIYMAHSILFQKLRRTLHQAHCQNSNREKAIETSKIPKYKRRKFLKMTTLAGSAAIATTAIPFAKSAQGRSTNPKIAIIGGGLAGLNAAYQLKKAGLKATVYEGKSRLGGRIRSVTGVAGKGIVSDLGGSFINTSHEDMLALVKEFNLSLFNRVNAAENLPFPSEGYFFEGRMHPEAEVAEKLRPIAKQILADATLLDEDFDRYGPKFDRLSVADYLEQHADKISEPYIKVLLGNSIRTEYGVETDSASLLLLLYALASVDGDKVAVIGGNDETYTVEKGSGKIIESLVAALPQQIQTKKRLQQISTDGDGYRLTFSDRSIVNADYVIVAIPISVLPKLDFQVDLEPKFKKFIQEVDLGKNEKAFAGFDKHVWFREDGFTAGGWTDLGFSGIYDNSQRQLDAPNSSLMFYLGSKEVTTAHGKPLSTLKQDFLDRFEEMIPESKSAATGEFFLTGWTLDPLIGGGYSSHKPGQYTEFNQFMYVESEDLAERQNVAFGNLIFAGEHFSDEYYGYMNGAAQTGRLAAEVLKSKVAVVK
jgi:monoamine oxidase